MPSIPRAGPSQDRREIVLLLVFEPTVRTMLARKNRGLAVFPNLWSPAVFSDETPKHEDHAEALQDGEH